ncbi:MAG: hypothetical protein J6B02_03840 [Selenomonadales bacterium]|nr:hypothetical protein [Selenomonadales bacterium]
MADANPHFISTSEVEIGMTGYAKTVVQGAEIEQFNVEVIGFTGGGAGRELVLVQVSGDVIERTGGVVQGMSGSPVYLNGRLLGAIAYGYKFGDATKCMVMPIEDMTNMWNMPDPLNKPISSAIDIKKIKEEKAKKEAEAKAEADSSDETAETADGDAAAEGGEAVEQTASETADQPADTAEQNAPAEQADETADKADEGQTADESDGEATVDSADAVPLATPVMVSGFSAGAFERLKADLAPLNMVPYAANSREARVTKRDLEPGSSIGAVLMRGDFSMGALGTVTYVEDDKMVAFGHPFMQIGNSNYFLANSEIYTTIDTLETGFKVGATGAPIGLINQDRSAGIAGVVGKLPATIPMEITVVDHESGIEKTFYLQAIHNEALSPVFLTAAFTNAIETTIDRKGAGTATVNFAIAARDLPGEVFERENMYYSMTDITTSASEEFGDMINQLMNNRFHPIEVMSVKASIDIDSGCRMAKLLEAETDKTEVRPGETVNFKVKLRPYRGDDIVEDVPYRVPSDHPGGEQELIFRGGGLPNTTVMEGIEKHRTPEDEKAVEELERKLTFEEILDKIRRKTRNNDIVIEENLDQVFTTIAEMKAEGDPLLEELEPKEDGVDLLGVKKRISEEAAKSIQRYPTLYVIDNEITATITVVRDDNAKDKNADKDAKDDKAEAKKLDSSKAADDKASSAQDGDTKENAKDDTVL